MASHQIKNLNSFFPNREIIGVKIDKLTSPGDNYGGALLSVDVTLQEEEHLRLVAKVLPQNEYLQKMFNSQRTFRNEVAFYEKIIPCLANFQQECGFSEFSVVPDFYGARFSLDLNSTEVDHDGVLLIKNIKEDGFNMIDRKLGFDLEQSQLILEKLAELHGTAYALKIQKPDVFKRQVETFLQEYKVFEGGEDAKNTIITSILELIQNDEISLKNLENIKNTLYVNCVITKNSKDIYTTTIFNSLVHSDLWINNIMLKIVDNTTVDLKFIDFQLYEYSSITRDIILFLFTSVNFEVLKRHLDGLIAFYYEKFIEILTRLKCDVSIFTFGSFLEEMAKMAKNSEFFHVMVMMKPIYAHEQESIDLEEMQENDFLQKRMTSSGICEERAIYVVHEFLKRGWL